MGLQQGSIGLCKPESDAPSALSPFAFRHQSDEQIQFL
jgi:hypothetical protein